MSVNPIVVLWKDIESQMYEVNKLQLMSFDGKTAFGVNTWVKGQKTSLEVTKALEAAAKRFADSEGSIYVPYGKSFISIIEEDKKYQVVQINPFTGDMVERGSAGDGFIKKAFLAHHLGIKLKAPVEYHFFLPKGLERVSFSPTNLESPGEGPMFNQSNGNNVNYLLQLNRKSPPTPKKVC